MRTPAVLLALIVLAAVPGAAEIIQSPEGGFSVDPPQGWDFVEDVTPEHFTMADASRNIALEVFSQPKGDLKTLKAKADDFTARLEAQGPQQTFAWNGQPAWISDMTRTLKLPGGALETRGYALVFDGGDRWISAIAYTPTKNYEKAYDQIFSVLDSLALGDEGLRTPGAMSVVFSLKSRPAAPVTQALTGLPSPFSLSYSPDWDDTVKAVMERETRILQAQVGKEIRDQSVIAPGWARFYRQIYRASWQSLDPLAGWWQAQVDQGKVKKAALAQTVLTWLQGFQYDRKGGLTDLSTPWQVLKEHAGDCDSLSLVYLMVMDHLGVPGMLMVSAPYDHGMAALDLAGEGARFPFEDKGWLVAELTDLVNLGMIQKDKSDPSQWIGVALPGHP